MKYNFEKRNIVCLFPWLTDSTAIKCTGQICETISVKYNLNAYIVTYKNEEYKRFNKYCPRTSLIFLKGKLIYGGWRVLLDLLSVILKYSKNIDILYLYHFPSDKIVIPLIGILYKFLNKRGALYVRLEADIAVLPPEFPTILDKGLLNRIKNSISIKFYKNVDILGVIDHTSFELSKKLKFWEYTGDKLKAQLNGYGSYEHFASKSFEKKKNNIVLAGRLNSSQKGLDIFLEALKKIDLKDWDVILMGEIDKEQIEEIRRVEAENKSAKLKIKYLGFVSDVSEYLKILDDAKIFCLPSRYDGIPLVIPDAMSRGCIIVGSDLYGIKTIATDNGNCGFYFPVGDSKALAYILNSLISDKYDLEEISNKSRRRAESIFHWDEIVNCLNLERFLK